jgi:hypothetical protein
VSDAVRDVLTRQRLVVSATTRSVAGVATGAAACECAVDRSAAGTATALSVLIYALWLVRRGVVAGRVTAAWRAGFVLLPSAAHLTAAATTAADLEWRVVYVGSGEDEQHDQELQSVLVGPVPVGVNKFVLEVRALSSREWLCRTALTRATAAATAASLRAPRCMAQWCRDALSRCVLWSAVSRPTRRLCDGSPVVARCEARSVRCPLRCAMTARACAHGAVLYVRSCERCLRVDAAVS